MVPRAAKPPGHRHTPFPPDPPAQYTSHSAGFPYASRVCAVRGRGCPRQEHNNGNVLRQGLYSELMLFVWLRMQKLMLLYCKARAHTHTHTHAHTHTHTGTHKTHTHAHAKQTRTCACTAHTHTHTHTKHTHVYVPALIKEMCDIETDMLKTLQQPMRIYSARTPHLQTYKLRG